MNPEFLKIATDNYRRAVLSADRTEIVRSASAMIRQHAQLGPGWTAVANQLTEWGELNLADKAFALWGEQCGMEQEARYEQAALAARHGQSERALAMLANISDEKPTPFANAYLRAAIAANLGNIDESERFLRETIRLVPDAGRAWTNLAQLGRLTNVDLETMRKQVQAMDSVDAIDRAALWNALAAVEHRDGNYSEAFQSLSTATKILGSRSPYIAPDNERSAAIVRQWNRDQIERLSKRVPAASRKPIFLTGLPRSGTTLVEQILSAHSAVDGGGELGLARQLEATVGGFAPDDFDKFLAGGGKLEELGGLYLRLVNERLPGNGIFVDKSLNQSRSIGPMSVLFPDAPIIWMRRDPLDNAFSIYRSWLAHNVANGWSLENIAHHMKIEDQLLEHWQQQLGERLMVLSYTDLVRDPARWITKLVAHSGLELEQQQLTPHLSARAVTTASAQQVREPINLKGLGVAERYREWLSPFIKAYEQPLTVGGQSTAAATPQGKKTMPSTKPSRPTPRPTPSFTPDPSFVSLSPRDLLDRLKAAMARRERAEINRLIAELIARKAPLGKQWRAMAMLSQHNGEYGLMRGVIDQWQREVGPMPDMLCEKARMEAQSGDPDGAWETVQQIDLARVDPLAIHFLKGTLSTSLGNLDAAADYLRTAVATAPASGQSWMALAMTGKMTDDDGQRMERARRAIVQAPLNEQATYQFALGRWKEKQKDYPAAFAAFEAGGALMVRERRFDPANDQRICDNALKFDRKKIDELAGNVTPRDHCRPLFVCGLPRSGTTLVEQILAAHSAVDGGGELGLMTTVEHDVGGNAPADLGAYLARGGSMDALRDLHDHLLQERFPGGGHVIDKTLNLSRTLGTVAAMYPEAKVVWMRRDPADCAWSAFRTYFMKSMDWSWRLDQIAEHFNLEDRLYRHWTEQLGDRILTVSYPDLVDDPAQWIERITRHFGLEPEAAQLESHKVERTVTTASAAQVREPINHKGIGSAAPYREMMKPFFDIYKGDML